MLFGNDVVDLDSMGDLDPKVVADILFMDQAVLADKLCPFPDECPEGIRCISGTHRIYVLGRYCRARAFAMRMMCSSC